LVLRCAEASLRQCARGGYFRAPVRVIDRDTSRHGRHPYPPWGIDAPEMTRPARVKTARPMSAVGTAPPSCASLPAAARSHARAVIVIGLVASSPSAERRAGKSTQRLCGADGLSMGRDPATGDIGLMRLRSAQGIGDLVWAVRATVGVAARTSETITPSTPDQQ
jgi:hypothetical protein